MTIFGCFVVYLAIAGFLALASLIWYIFYSTADEGLADLNEMLSCALWWPAPLIGAIVNIPKAIEWAKKARIKKTSAKEVQEEPKVDSVDTLA